jgi:hypothetical protein
MSETKLNVFTDGMVCYFCEKLLVNKAFEAVPSANSPECIYMCSSCHADIPSWMATYTVLPCPESPKLITQEQCMRYALINFGAFQDNTFLQLHEEELAAMVAAVNNAYREKGNVDVLIALDQ